MRVTTPPLIGERSDWHVPQKSVLEYAGAARDLNDGTA
jgi:hypothetical protein